MEFPFFKRPPNIYIKDINIRKEKMKKTVYLNESKLHNIIRESLKGIISELNWKTYMNAAHKAYDRNDDRVDRFRDAAIDRFNSEYSFDETDNDGGYDRMRMKPLYDTDMNSFRRMKNGKTINPVDRNSPHVALHREYASGDGNYGGSYTISSDLDNDGDRSIAMDYDYNNGEFPSTAPVRTSAPQFSKPWELGKDNSDIDKGFKEFDTYRRNRK